MLPPQLGVQVGVHLVVVGRVRICAGGGQRWPSLPRYPPKTRRYELKCRRNQDRFVILGRARRVPDDWAGGDRRRGGVSRTQAFAWNCGNQTPDAKGEAQAEKNREARVPM